MSVLGATREGEIWGTRDGLPCRRWYGYGTRGWGFGVGGWEGVEDGAETWTEGMFKSIHVGLKFSFRGVSPKSS